MARSARRGCAVLREHGPRLRQRIELALLVLHRPERRSIVEVGAAIPVAVPGQFQHAGQPSRLVPVDLREIASPAALADRGEVVQHGHEKPAEPHAFAAAGVSDAIHPVVPVSRADERQSVRAVFHRVRDGAHRVLEERRGFRGHARQHVRFRPDRVRAAVPRGTGRLHPAPTRRRSATRSWRRRTAARADRRSSVFWSRVRSAGATSAARLPRRTAATRRAGGARDRGPAARTSSASTSWS